MRNFNWKNTRNDKIENVIDYIKERMNEDYLPTDEFKIYVGCDSLPTRKRTAIFSTVICLYCVGRGAQVIFSRERNIQVFGENKIERMKNRLREEIYRATDAAMIIMDSDLLLDKRIIDYQVHIDINPNEEFASNLVYKEAIGYVSAMGFDVYAKPHAMAASFAGDAICRSIL